MLEKMDKKGVFKILPRLKKREGEKQKKFQFNLVNKRRELRFL